MSIAVFLFYVLSAVNNWNYLFFHSSVITLSRLYQTDHEAVIVSKPLQGWPKQFDFAQAKLIVMYMVYLSVILLWHSQSGC